jgi:predicted nucleic-acid-binding protein
VIGIDTNVLVRYIAQDDAIQSARATRLLEHECSAKAPGFISLVVLLELVWVSESCYGASRAEIAGIVRRILSIRQLLVQEAEIAWKVLRLFESSKADFADCLVERIAAEAGCTAVMTFDKAAAKVGMTLLA